MSGRLCPAWSGYGSERFVRLALVGRSCTKGSGPIGKLFGGAAQAIAKSLPQVPGFVLPLGFAPQRASGNTQGK